MAEQTAEVTVHIKPAIDPERIIAATKAMAAAAYALGSLAEAFGAVANAMAELVDQLTVEPSDLTSGAALPEVDRVE